MVEFHVERPSNDNLITGKDSVLPFLLHNSGIRGRFARLEGVVQEILTKHNYPKAISYILAEGLVIASQLGTMLKSEGAVTLQAQGTGPIDFMVIHCTYEGGLRGYIQAKNHANFRGMKAGSSLPSLFGTGRLAIIMNQIDKKQQYQGIVSLEGQNLSEAIERYFKESEQIDTYFHVIISPATKDKPWCAGGMMLQHLPRNQEDHIQAHEHAHFMEEALILAKTLTKEELYDAKLTSHELLFRLFHEQHVITYTQLPIAHQCGCSRERMQEMIATFTSEQREEMKKNGVIEITCQFCSHQEIFTEADLALIPPS